MAVVQAYQAADGLVSRKNVFALTCDAALGFVAVVIFVPLRLGIKEANPVYHAKLKQALQQPHCIGILGGRPRHSLYFLGFQGDELLALDPHTCRAAQDLANPATPLHVRAGGMAGRAGSAAAAVSPRGRLTNWCVFH